MQKKIVNGMEVLIGAGNVYADLGFPDAEEMLVKARLAYTIIQTIKAKGWTQQQAAEVSGAKAVGVCIERGTRPS